MRSRIFAPQGEGDIDSSRSPESANHQGVVATVVRRVLLSKTKQHVYYSIAETTETVVIHTIWGAQRGHSPKL
jgi:hypothetical protein